MSLSRSVTSLCTVDLEIANFLAVWRMVALFSMMYWVNSNTRSSDVYKRQTLFVPAMPRMKQGMT